VIPNQLIVDTRDQLPPVPRRDPADVITVEE